MYMFRKSKKAAVLDKTSNASDIANRAAEVAQQAAERATILAQSAIELARPAVHSARSNATPAVRRSASVASGKLSSAAERASSVLADTADWLSETSDHQRSLSKKAEKKHRKLKGLMMLSALVGGGVALVKSPFGGKLRDKLTGGPYPDELEPEGITLSVDHHDDMPSAKVSVESNGVAASKAKEHADN